MNMGHETRERTDLIVCWVVIGAVILVKAILISDITVQITSNPHDDNLYVLRAYHLLRGEAFGDYDARALAKLPGISFWLASIRGLGIPYLLAINIIYVGAGIYLIRGLRVVGVGRGTLLFGFALYMFNPLTFGVEWGRILREPLSAGLMVAMLASLLHLLLALNGRVRTWPHLTVLSVLFAFSLLLREEDKLLWGLLGLFILAATYEVRAWNNLNKQWRRLALLLIFPILAAVSSDYLARSFVQHHYGEPILHDYGEGEFPRLMAAIRSIESKVDNRLVMAPQDVLQRLRTLVPEFAPVVDRLPSVGPNTFSCRLQGVCSEWSNGWMPFWIKDSAAAAGLTPDLRSAQRYFREVREKIETLCGRGELACRAKGDGLLPPMELRWTRAFLLELRRVLWMAIYPDPHTLVEPPATYRVPLEIGRIYQLITMTSGFDTLAQFGMSVGGDRPAIKNPLAPLRLLISIVMRLLGAFLIVAGLWVLVWRWVMYPKVPFSAVFWLGAVFWSFSILRMLALGYVAVFFGPFEPRIVFSTYTVALALSCFLIWDYRQAKQRNFSLGS